MASSPTKTGQCLCGAIKYKLAGPSAKPYYNTVCHCLNCRRATGSAFLLASICPRDGSKVTQGAEHQKEYCDIATDSGTKLKRDFCSQCGSKLFAYTPLWDEIVSVTAGTLDDFDSWVPDTEQWCVHRASFLTQTTTVSPDRTFDKAVQKE
ncbi:Putative glutathione-dependent formaldehyde-activating enzyme [Fulvia fulva]|uniref:Glutathione-dependent formaldehyde-activating enzyme n=1 Tax=Passalora fulva TaxID=5499 RepID=A0A9Q8PJB4_PASFU|nr:Putative glutathione-dependent formaldehyde-activating enzyme [Fulvia fulva]KAK4612165.1 putative glutathione-dependent formaldehyde-activating enzyme [Fulvia fulva]KAK4613167.1 putative glutathione-dependent formaldehyde-activating enzyme [Fulvia fulva]UJO23465.1 Putative glutathione-dependent formaldehyde-activating enzyme [Fulvia fulva]WPV21023.1 Putative glutathione-dependent formaldehyde-activating enzyme [Fulvia fulva]WPV35823.1 Putative glutathione-dependent formaldehyde-activating e